jgi:VanZ family protein
MQGIKDFVNRWGMAIVMMAAIFFFSSTPGDKLPNYGISDTLVKKGGHMLGYGLLSLSYWRGLKWDKKHLGWAWVFAVFYALTDEFHQSFVSGRHPSLLDVILFDSTGAAIGLWVAHRMISPRKI